MSPWIMLGLAALIVFLLGVWALVASGGAADDWADRMAAEIAAVKRERRREALRRLLRRAPPPGQDASKGSDPP